MERFKIGIDMRTPSFSLRISFVLFLAMGCLLVTGCKKTKDDSKSDNKNKSAKVKKPKLVPKMGKDERLDYFLVNFRPTSSEKYKSEQGQFSKGPVLAADVKKMHLEFMQDGMELLEKSLHQMDAASAPAKIDFVKRTLDLLTRKPLELNLEADEALLKDAEKFAASNSTTNDPVFQTCLAKVLEKHDTIRAFQLADSAVKAFPGTEYPCRWVIHAHRIRKQTNKAETKRLDHVNAGQLAETLLYWLTEDLHATPDQYRFIADHIKNIISDLYSKSHELKIVQKVFQENKKIPRYLSEFALGCINNRMAWDARGEGTADSVSQEGWRLFERHQRKAAVHFRNAHHLNPNFPQTAYEMIDIARAGNIGESVPEWFEKARKAQYDYIPAYDNRIFDLYPQWHGSLGKMLEFGRECLATKRFDTFVPYYYFAAVTRVCSANSAFGPSAIKQLYRDHPKLLEDAEACVEGYMAHNPNGKGRLSKKFLYSLLTTMAIYSDDTNKAKKYFDLLNGDYSQTAFDMLYAPEPAENLKALVDASIEMSDSGKSGSEMKDYRRAWRRAKTIEKQSALMKQIDEYRAQAKSESAKLFWDVERRNLTDRMKFEKGEWVEHLFEKGLGSWSSLTNIYSHPIDKDQVEIRLKSADKRYNFKLDMKLFLKGPKIIEYTIEHTKHYFKNDQKTLHRNFRPGISIMGTVKSPFYVMHDMHLNHICFFGGGQHQRYAKYPPGAKKFRILCGDRYVEVRCDGKLILRNRLARVGDAAKLSLHNLSGSGWVRYSNLRIKKWELGPPPVVYIRKNSEFDQLFTYYQKATKLEPDDGEHWKHLGMLYYRKQQFEEARKAFNTALEKGLTKRIIGFYLGDMLEREGKIEKAKKEYYEAGIVKQKYEIDADMVVALRLPNPHRRASLRYRWLYLTDPANANKSYDEIRKHLAPLVGIPADRSYPQWSTQRIEAARYAAQKKYDGAIRSLKKIKKAPQSAVDDIKRQLAAYQSNQPYSPESGQTSFYMMVKQEPFFFRYWDHILPQDLVQRHR